MKGKVIGIGLMVIGIAIVGWALLMYYQGSSKQSKMLNDYEKAIQQYKNMGEAAVQTSGNEASPGQKSPSQDINGAVGIMIIPKIDLKVAIGEGVDMDTLKYAVGHFENTALPGQKGNFCVAGHRSYTYNEYFNRLDELVNGDEIIVRTLKGEYTYKVYDQKVVEPTEVSVLDPTKDATLTLVTCTPVRVATHRLIIKAKLVEK